MSGYNNSPYPPPPSSNQQSPYPQQHQAGASTGFPTANPYGGGGDPYAQGYGWGAPAQQPGAGYGYQGMQGGPSPPGQRKLAFFLRSFRTTFSSLCSWIVGVPSSRRGRTEGIRAIWDSDSERGREGSLKGSRIHPVET
ncbi:hypothetical protein T439DRAFT_152072 [Meredithblackwellia eburnea MCA 4105]